MLIGKGYKAPTNNNEKPIKKEEIDKGAKIKV